MSNHANEEEFVSELTAHQSALQAFVISLMPGDNGVDEVIQRTNITLWRKRESYQLGTNFRAWSFECAKWTLRAYLKEKKRANWLIVDDELTQAITDRMVERIPELSSAPQVALRMCLGQLRPIDRDLLLSHYENKETLAEIAERSDRTVGTLKVTLFRLRAAMRRCISDRLATGATER